MGGGVELTLRNISQVLSQRGHLLEVVAPKGSWLPNMAVTEIEGQIQVQVQTQSRQEPISMPCNSVLANMWAYARQVQDQFDLIVNFAYDWLPFYLTPCFKTPIAHLVSMGSLNDAMDDIIGQVAMQYPHAVAVNTRTQADTFPFGKHCMPLSKGLNLGLYDYCDEPEDALCWLGRISPEKGLEDAIAAAQSTGLVLKIMGHLQDEAYFEQIKQDFPAGSFEYLGFLPTQEMQQVVRRCKALLMTHRWIEAFGNVAIEALACGVPVISYRRGGPAEIVREGQTGWLVEPDSVDGLIAAIQKLDKIDRQICRQQVEQEYSLEAMGDRVEAWFEAVLQSAHF